MKRMKMIQALSALLVLSLSLSACQTIKKVTPSAKVSSYDEEMFPLKRKGISLHLERTRLSENEPKDNILLVHGVTYSSKEFDIDYQDYSLVKKLANEGYAVWQLDIAGFGQSEEVKDGFMPDSDYAADDIGAAINKIVAETGEEKIDLLGWSWGTVTASRYTGKHPEHIDKLVLFAPILSGLGKDEIKTPFHHNTWERAADDFQLTKDGDLDHSITDPLLVELWCSTCWHYDKESSPNGGRRDLCVKKSKKLINLKKIKCPTLVICGDKDTYLNYKLVDSCLEKLPEGSSLEVIEGGSHTVFVEKPFYKDFQSKLLHFLED